MKNLLLFTLLLVAVGCSKPDKQYVIEWTGTENDLSTGMPTLYTRVDTVTCESDSAAYLKALFTLYANKKGQEIAGKSYPVRLTTYIIKDPEGGNVEMNLDEALKKRLNDQVASLSK